VGGRRPGRRCHLAARLQPSGGGPRSIPMNETVFDTLRGMVRRIDNPYVFPGKEPASHGADLPKSWEGFLVKASVEDFRWHDLRHVCKPVGDGWG
jgi:hypothetical protein